MSGPSPLNKALLEQAAILAGYTFFATLLGFVTAGVFTKFENVPGILIGAGIAAGYAFFGKLYLGASSHAA